MKVSRPRRFVCFDDAPSTRVEERPRERVPSGKEPTRSRIQRLVFTRAGADVGGAVGSALGAVGDAVGAGEGGTQRPQAAGQASQA